ncbi:TBC1 domain family member 22B-like [Saccostrea cucullata]|uniref:TBC1 domain family member 22B-like n=1 Tax=Saccostrea cuccullata TaxID=36930 RepID=UPI002ED0BFC2
MSCSIKPVYGAQHPPLQVMPKGKEERSKTSNKRDAFQDFENNTSDAWDDGDDDLLVMANIQMSLRDVRSTAQAVMENHSKQLSAQNQQTSSVKDELRKLSWSGIPKPVRATAWKILSGYLPASLDRREPTLQRKRHEYFGFIEQYYDTRHQEIHQDTFRQQHLGLGTILKDIPRMTSLAHLFQQKVVQEIFERILYIWAIRHPASGYVQGINDLVTPFFVVFLSEFIDNDVESENFDLCQLPQETLNIIEADSFWCTSRLLDGIQDNYTFAQPGIQMKVNALKELIKRIDVPLYKHLEEHCVEFLQFSFRWMNNILMREIPLRCTIRLWDTYQAEQNGFADFHLYVCAAFLVRFTQDVLREQDFQGILMFLQNLPTHHWQNEEIGELLAEAYKLKFMFADAPNHLSKKK